MCMSIFKPSVSTNLAIEYMFRVRAKESESEQKEKTRQERQMNRAKAALQKAGPRSR